MKRLNPDTGKPFVRGDTRADGFLFYKYGTRVKNDGVRSEIWLSPESFNNVKTCNTRWLANNRLSSNGRAISLITSAIRRCDLRGKGVVTITKDWIQSALDAGVCQLTGLPFDMSPPTKTRMNPYAPSLDRIDSSNPDYSENNTRLVLSCVNIALSDHGLDVLLPVMKALVEKQTNV